LITLKPIFYAETGIHNLSFRIYDSLGPGGKFSEPLYYIYVVRNHKPEWKISSGVKPLKSISMKMNSYQEMILPDYYDMENHTINFIVYETIAGRNVNVTDSSYIKYVTSIVNTKTVRTL
jgi:hypothetical protein